MRIRRWLPLLALLLAMELPAQSPIDADWSAFRERVGRDAEAEMRAAEQRLTNARTENNARAAAIAELQLTIARVDCCEQSQSALDAIMRAADRAALAGEPGWAGHAWRSVGRRYFQLGDYGSAESSALRALESARQIGDRRQEAQSLNDLGVLAKRRGDWRNARLNYENALSIRRAIDDQTGLAQTLGNLAMIDKNRGSLFSALNYQREVTDIARKLGKPETLANALDASALILLAAGDAVAAENLLREAIQLGDLPRNQDALTRFRINLGAALLAQDRIDEADREASAAAKFADQAARKPLLTSASLLLASIARRRGELSKAATLLQTAGRIAEELGEPKEIIEVQNEQVALLLAEGSAEKATVTASQALTLARKADLRLLEREALDLLAQAQFAAGTPAEAYRTRLEFEQLSAELTGVETLRRMAGLLAPDASQAEKTRLAELERQLALAQRARQQWAGLSGLAAAGLVLSILIQIGLTIRNRRARD